jgi:hypothetical protein
MFRHTRSSSGNGPLTEWGKGNCKSEYNNVCDVFFIEIDKELGIKELITNFGVECWSNTLKIAHAVT